MFTVLYVKKCKKFCNKIPVNFPGGVLRLTVSLCVIVMESVQSLSLGLALTVVLVVAKFVGDKFTAGLYDIHIELMEVPLLPWEPPSQASAIPAT